MDFFTPEVFDVLVIGNLIVGAGLIAYRFYGDMTRTPAYRQQNFDESSREMADDTHPSRIDDA